MMKEKIRKKIKRTIAGLVMLLSAAAFVPETQIQAAPLVESEPNGNPGSADQLPLNTWIKGSSIDSDDQDWYEINITRPGVSYLEIRPDDDETREDAQWNIQLTDANRNVLIEADTLVAKASYSESYGWAPGKYYLRVKAYWEFWQGSHGGKYKLMFHYEPSDQWEQELYYENKSLANANIVYTNRAYTGNLYCRADQDYYRFKLNGKNKISLKFDIDNSVSDPGTWKVEFIEYNTRQRLNGAGEQVNTNRTLTVECTGDLLVRISNGGSWGNYATKQQYHIQANVISGTGTSVKPVTSAKPSRTSITSVKAGKKKATLRWKKSSNATGYYVYRSTSAKGKYRKIATVTKTSYVDKKNLKSKKTYYYKIVAYKKSGSKITKAAASKYKKVRVR